MLEFFSVADVDEKPGMEIPMGEVDARILAKVVEYCKYHHLSDRSGDEVERWERDFVAVDKSTLFQLILVRVIAVSRPLLCRLSLSLMRRIRLIIFSQTRH